MSLSTESTGHLVRHAKLAQEMDIPQKNTFVLQNGDVLSLNSSKAQVRRGCGALGRDPC